MALEWTDTAGIAAALAKAYPDADRIHLACADVLRLVSDLPEFSGDSPAPDEQQLNAILWTWMRLADPDSGVGAAR